MSLCGVAVAGLAWCWCAPPCLGLLCVRASLRFAVPFVVFRLLCCVSSAAPLVHRCAAVLTRRSLLGRSLLMDRGATAAARVGSIRPTRQRNDGDSGLGTSERGSAKRDERAQRRPRCTAQTNRIAWLPAALDRYSRVTRRSCSAHPAAPPSLLLPLFSLALLLFS